MTALKTFISIITQHASPVEETYINLINIYREQIRNLNNKLDSNKDAGITDPLYKQNKCTNYLLPWIEMNKLYVHGLFMENEIKKIKNNIWNEWINNIQNEINNSAEGTEENNPK